MADILGIHEGVLFEESISNYEVRCETRCESFAISKHDPCLWSIDECGW